MFDSIRIIFKKKKKYHRLFKQMSILRRTKRDGPSNDEGRSKSMRAVYHA